MRRIRFLVIVLSLGLAWGVLAWDGRPDGAQPVVIDITGQESGSGINIVWGGDTMLGDGASPSIAARGHGWVLDGVVGLLEDAVVIVNAEAPITTRDEPFTPSKIYSYRTDPEAAPALAEAGVSVLGLSNNHAMDQGPIGLGDTIRHAAEAGMATFGAGQTDAEAERPIMIRNGDLTIGVVGLARGYGTKVTANPMRAGTVPFSTASIIRGYELAKAAGADFVIGYVHWGSNYQQVTEEQRTLATKFADAGYDLVIGHGPHIFQPAEMVGSMPVFYSLGNFVFGAPGLFSPDLPGYGVVLRTEFTDAGLSGVTVNCIVTDNDLVIYQPRSCSTLEENTFRRTLNIEGLTIGLVEAPASALDVPSGTQQADIAELPSAGITQPAAPTQPRMPDQVTTRG